MKAFTMVEIIVVMIITSVVISASMLLYTNMNKIQHSSFCKGEEDASLVLLTDVLRKDCQEAARIACSGTELQCVKDKGTVCYSFESERILRKGLVVDTFPFQVKNIRLAYADSAHKALNMLSFTLMVKSDSLPFYYYKKYFPQMLLELENNR